MHARSINVLGDPEAIDDGITYVRDTVMPTIEKAEGCIGLSMLVDRESGRCIVATSWADRDALKGSADQFARFRDHLLTSVGGHDADGQQWDIAVLHRERPAGEGAAGQVTWARIQPRHVDDLVDAYKMNLLPKLGGLPGFCSVSLMVDHKTGRTVSVTSFESREALRLVRKEARLMREQFALALGAKIVDIAEMELAIAHLRVPETA